VTATQGSQSVKRALFAIIAVTAFGVSALPFSATVASATWWCTQNVACAQVFMQNPRVGVWVEDSITVFYHPSGCIVPTVLFSGESYTLGGNLINKFIWKFGDGTQQTAIVDPPLSHVASDTQHTYPSATQNYTADWVIVTVSGSGVVSHSTVSVQAVSSCSYTVSASISPSSQTVYFNLNGCLVPTASFTGSASGGYAPYTYGWTFGDGSTGTGNPIQHTYPLVAKTYSVGLVATDSNGVSGSAGSTVTVVKVLYC